MGNRTHELHRINSGVKGVRNLGQIPEGPTPFPKGELIAFSQKMNSLRATGDREGVIEAILEQLERSGVPSEVLAEARRHTAKQSVSPLFPEGVNDARLARLENQVAELQNAVTGLLLAQQAQAAAGLRELGYKPPRKKRVKALEVAKQLDAH
jgi:hypothetical protein